MRSITLSLIVVVALSSAFVGPPASKAQRPAKVWKIGTLSTGSASPRDDALRQGLRDLGYVEGQNVTIEARHAEAKLERLLDLAAELVRLNVDVIVASPTQAVRAAQQATRTIPIVMAFSSDPVGAGLVMRLANPGGNITGLTSISSELNGKRLELFKAVLPDVATVCFLVTPATQKPMLEEAADAGRALGLKISNLTVQQPSELERAFTTAAKTRYGGMLVDWGVFAERGRQVAELALKHRLPTVSGAREFAEAGGLMTYGPDYAALYRRAATYVDKILKGANPGDLPVEQPTKFEMVINLKTAKALGLTIPQSVLGRADDVIK